MAASGLLDQKKIKIERGIPAEIENGLKNSAVAARKLLRYVFIKLMSLKDPPSSFDAQGVSGSERLVHLQEVDWRVNVGD